MAAKNKDFIEVDCQVQNKMATALIKHKSFDYMISQDDAVNYLIEFLKSPELSG